MASNLSIGAEVYTADGERLGKVKEVEGNAFKVDAPMAPDYWLSMESVRGAEGDAVRTSFTKDQLNEYRVSGMEHGTTGDTRDTDEGRTRTGREVDEVGRREERITDAGTVTAGATAMREGSRATGEVEGETLELREERLRVETEQERAGEVRLGTRVVEREETVNVPLREERVVIERRPGSGEVVDDDIDARRDETIEVDVMRERAVVDKEAVVTEEVDVRKETVQHDERVSETLRREELVVEGDQGVTVQGGQRTGLRDQDVTEGDNAVERTADRVGDAAQRGVDRLRGRG